MRRILLAALVCALGVCPSADAQADKSKYPVLALEGKEAPAFATDFAINAPKATLNDLKGKVVLVDFWAVWCPPCRAAFPSLIKLHEDYNKKGLEIVGLTKYYGRNEFKLGKLTTVKTKVSQEDEREMLKAFVKHHKLPYRIQISPAAFTDYKVGPIPTALLIDKKGTIRMVKVGFSPTVGMKAVEEKIKALLDEK